MAIVHFVNYKRGTQSRAAMRGVMLYVMQEKKSASITSQFILRIQFFYFKMLGMTGF